VRECTLWCELVPIIVILTFQSFDHHVFGIDVVVALFQFLFKTFDHVFAFLGHLNNTQRQQKKIHHATEVIEKNKKSSNKNQEPNKKQGFKNNLDRKNGQKTQSTHATYSGFVVVHTFHVQFRVQYPLVSL